MRVVATLLNAALIIVWGLAITRMLGRRLRELARRQQDLLRRLDAIHRATVLGIASIRAAVREAAREVPPPDGGAVATMTAGGRARRPGECRDHDALRRWSAARARRTPRRPAAAGRVRGRSRRLRP
jgi:Flp pilus assembly protein TadB